MNEEPRPIFGLPIIVSDLIPEGEIWTFGPPAFPGGPPTVVKLRGLAPDDVTEETES